MIVEPIGPVIIPGRLYRYLPDWPRGCKGGLYRVERFIKDVPTYSERVLVHCVKGQDKGLWFCCTPANFVACYEIVEEAMPTWHRFVPVTQPERVVDLSEKGKGY